MMLRILLVLVLDGAELVLTGSLDEVVDALDEDDGDDVLEEDQDSGCLANQRTVSEIF